jgi:chaperone required for assembly of F1-ATPase
MRDILDHIFRSHPFDPEEAARRSLRSPLRKRFYAAAGVAEGPDGYGVELDNRPIRTPGQRALAVPTRPLAEALAAEWNAQRELIDPAIMPLTRLANSILDGVVDAPGPVAEEVTRYFGSDLVCYRASAPPELVARQSQHWDPVLTFARDALNARFVLGEGIVFVAQPEHALAAARAAIPDDPWRLGAVNAITGLTGSALIALALAHGAVSAEAAWAAAHVDEDWNGEQWGFDEQAMASRAAREAEMKAAAALLKLLSSV